MKTLVGNASPIPLSMDLPWSIRESLVEYLRHGMTVVNARGREWAKKHHPLVNGKHHNLIYTALP